MLQQWLGEPPVTVGGKMFFFLHCHFFFQLENSGPEMHGLYSFAVIAEGKEFLLAAHSEEEKYKWVEVRIE